MAKNILIVKIGGIGDVVMALPLVSYFQKETITWVVGKEAEPIIKATGKVAKILVVDEKRLFRGPVSQRFAELIRIQYKLAGRYFDLILTGHADWRYLLFSLFARGKERRSFERGSKRQCPVPGRYHGDEYLRLAAGTDTSHCPHCELPSLALYPSAVNHQAIVLAPGGAKNPLADDALRRWPIDHYVTLAQELDTRGIQVILTGSASDAWILPYFEGIRYQSFVGKLDLLGLIRLLQNVKLLVTHDSGPLHLAKLARCRAIGLFGPTNPWEKVGREERDLIKVLWGGEKLPCRPCYDGKRYASCTQNKCLQSIAPEQVLQEVLQIWKSP